MPEYTAVMEWLPVERLLVEQVAALPETTIAEQPAIEAAPSRKSTVPVGAPADPETLAVNVTLCPAVEGFAEETTLTAGFTLTAFTVWVVAGEVAAL